MGGLGCSREGAEAAELVFVGTNNGRENVQPLHISLDRQHDPLVY